MNPRWTEMVKNQLAARGISEKRTLRAMSEIDRADFVPEALQSRAYEHGPLPIGYNQTISQPYIVGFMTQCIVPAGAEDSIALELGAGCGYQSAILSKIFSRVIAFELVPELADLARQNLAALGITNVEIRTGDGSAGCPGQEFNAILGAAAFSVYPKHLESQLKIGGRMILPAGTESQSLFLASRSDAGITRKRVLAVRFVPMIDKN